jgi:hypothetical protein
MNPDQDAFQKQLAERFKQLPKVVQDAITSADIQKRLRELASAHQLHIDEWNTLENEVMLTVMGFERPESLEKNIQKEIGVSTEIAHALATGISQIVFEPIRQELERQLEHPAAKEVVLTGVEAARSQALSGESGTASASAAPPAPTPPTPAPDTTAVRAPASGAYKPGEASTERKSVVDDPYREEPK